MKHIRLDRSQAERQERMTLSFMITDGECKKQMEKQRKNYPINSENFSKIPKDEDLGVLAKHPLGRG